MSLWGGRFAEQIDGQFKAFNDSLRFDFRLLSQDIQGSIAWCEALAEAKVLTDAERQSLITALQDLDVCYAQVLMFDESKSQDKAKQRQAIIDEILASGEEDIHSWVETQLIKRCGDLGKKLHFGRSRNDQVATDLRLYCRDKITYLGKKMLTLLTEITHFAERNRAVVFPGYTHLQSAQPVSVGHWALAYGEMIKRDLRRLKQANSAGNRCPLGSAALAGTTVPIDRFKLARSLGFSGPTANSIDAVSDRDFVMDLLYAAATNFIHLSRMAEDIIFYVSGEAGYFTLADSLSTGSSIMPQKKNPDALELIRGKSGRVIGHLNALMVTLKGLPTAYNKDLQEDKELLFETLDFWPTALSVLSAVMASLKVNATRCEERIAANYLNATDLANYLVLKGLAFRDAHDICGQVVNYAEQAGKPLEALTLTEMQQFSDKLEEDVFTYIDPKSIVNYRDVYGGTNLVQIELAIGKNKAFLQSRTPVDFGAVEPATLQDVDGIEALVSWWAKKGENLPRSRQEIISQIQDFLVVRDMTTVLGCGSLYVYHDDLAEIRSLGVAEAAQGKGTGKKLVQAFIDKSRVLQVKRLFVLTRVPAFFSACGFTVGDKRSLPEKVMKDCQLCPKLHACDEIAMIYEP